MREAFVVEAEVRTAQGKGASRRLRHEGKVPAIIYGGKGEPQPITVNHNELSKHLKIEAFYSHILTVKIGDATEQAVLKDLHRHPVLSGAAISNITNSKLDGLVVTDTIPLSPEAAACPKIRQLSIAGLLAETIRRVSAEESVSSLYID